MTQLDRSGAPSKRRCKTYFDTIGKQIEQQQATFREVAAAK